MEDVRNEVVTEACDEVTCEVGNPNYVGEQAPEPKTLEEMPFHVQLDVERERHYREQTRVERLDMLSLEILRLGDSNFTPEIKKLASTYLKSRFE